jgi:hypothetical protein
MSYTIDKYKQSLLQIKKDLMKDISRYLTKGIFEFEKKILIYKLIPSGSTFPNVFDYVSGNEHYLRLSHTDCTFMNVNDFNDENIDNVEKEIPFLMELLYTIEFYNKKKYTFENIK